MTIASFLDTFTVPATPTSPLTIVGWKVQDHVNYSSDPDKASDEITSMMARLKGRFHFDATSRGYSAHS
jgi:hypothetical protein